METATGLPDKAPGGWHAPAWCFRLIARKTWVGIQRAGGALLRDSSYVLHPPGGTASSPVPLVVQRGGNLQHSPLGGSVPFWDVLLWA